MNISLNDFKRFYIVGIKGVGMTALAQLLQARGHHVQGSDVAEPFFTNEVLKRHHIPFTEGFDPKNVPEDIDAVIYSTAYNEENPEIKESANRKIPLVTYPEVLGELLRTSEGVSVAGTHGKTTTTAIVGSMLAHAGKDPTVIVGSNIKDFGGNALVGASNLLVMETDEYQNKFRYYAPKHLLLTNIEYDHPDFFPTEHAYIKVFVDFIEKIPEDGIVAWNVDDPISATIMQDLKRPTVTFGKSKSAAYRLGSSIWVADHQQISIWHKGEEHIFQTRLPGVHNAYNILAAAAWCHAFGIEWGILQTAVAKFVGAARRFELKGSHNGALLIDDYAHHPTEIRAAIAAARQQFPDKRLTVVFQPHTYSRTKALLQDFADALVADTVILLAIYGSAREKEQTVTSEELAVLLPASVHPNVLQTPAEAAAYLRTRIDETDIVLLLGAGDVWTTADLIRQPQ